MTRWTTAGIWALVVAVLLSAWWNNQEIRNIGLRVNPSIDLQVRNIPMTATAHVSFTNGTHSETFLITAGSTSDVDDEVARTRARLATAWGVGTNDVTVTYLTN